MVDIPITDHQVNYQQNQIIINLVLHSFVKPKKIHLIDNGQRITLQLSKNYFESNVVNFVRKYIAPNVPYYDLL